MNWNFVDDPPREIGIPLLFWDMRNNNTGLGDIELMEWYVGGYWECHTGKTTIYADERELYPDAWLAVKLPTKQEVHNANE